MKSKQLLRRINANCQDLIFVSNLDLQTRLISAIASRFLMLLWTRKARLGTFNILTLNIIVGDTDQICSKHLIPPSQLQVYYSTPLKVTDIVEDAHDAFVKLLSKVLIEVSLDDEVQALVVESERALLKYRNEVKIPFFCRKVKQYTIQIYLTALENFPDFFQCYLLATNELTNQTIQRFIVEASIDEITALVDNVRIYDGQLQIVPKSSSLGTLAVRRMSQRGFDAPFSFDMGQLFA
ncbi:MAG: hypothetical protein JST01_22090 [Cyanobacteria bacterium SZAS TMP-1]|nr:hypothetical protein [Cyanobacteria bacterium SZAS TMP-1]